MIFHKQQVASRNRFHMCGDSLAEATTLASNPTEPWEAGSMFELIGGPTSIWTGTKFEPVQDAPVLLTDTTVTINGTYTAIEYLSDGVQFGVLTSNLKSNGATPTTKDEINNLQLPQGQILRGVFTSIKLTGGKVLLYP